MTVQAGDEYVHAAVRFMDVEFLGKIAKNLMIDDLHFAEAEAAGTGAAAHLPWLDPLVWNPATPGHDLVARTAPVLGLLFAAFVTLSGWLLVHLTARGCRTA